jgi:carbonic anhydrase
MRGALEGTKSEMLDRWLAPPRRLAAEHREELAALPTVEARADRLAELNAIAQARRVSEHPAVVRARSAGRQIAVHGWVIEITTGRLRELVALESDGRPVQLRA